MLEQNFIIKDPQFKDSQNFQLLRATALQHIEELSHQIWTDYNIHDPGITIAELLCYAITDLGYRTNFDIKDLLTPPANATTEKTFYSAAEIFPSHPVTFNDLRKILIDIDGVFNAWISKNKEIKYTLDEVEKTLTSALDTAATPLNGLFDVLVQFEDFVGERINSSFGKALETGGSYITPSGKGLKFEVLSAVHLESVTVVAESDGTVMVRLLDTDNNDINCVETEVLAGTPTIVPLKWQIREQGNYSLDAGSTTIKLHKANTTSSEYPYVEKDLIQITGMYPSNNTSRYYFFFDWQISPIRSTADQNATLNLTEDEVLHSVKEKLYTLRNLCEDFVHIRQLKQEQIAVCMDLDVHPSAELAEVLAEIYYQLELYVSPPVNFYTIKELFDKGKTSDQIFEGPLLDHGFIDDDEFRAMERRKCLRTSDIIQIIMDVEGVLAVKSISLLSFIEKTVTELASVPLKERICFPHPDQAGEEQWFQFKEEEWLLDLQDASFYAPDFVTDKSKVFFYKNDLPYQANRKVTENLLSEKRAQQIQKKLKAHERDLPMPTGNYRALDDYYPIQNDLPETYFVGQNPVPASRSKLRKAQSKQLKAYLLFFEQLFANYLSQLANAKHLFSMAKAGEQDTYFTQKIDEIHAIDELYKVDYNTILDTELKKIIESPKLAGARKNRFLDHLIGRFAEDFTDYGLMQYSLKLKNPTNVSEDTKIYTAKRLITDKQAFLSDYPKQSSERGKGFDYRYPNEANNLTGFQRRVYRLLGIYDKDCKAIRQNFSNPDIEVVEVPISDGKSDYYFQICEEENGVKSCLFQSATCSKREQVCTQIDVFLAFGANRKNWCQLDLNPFDGAIAGKHWILKRNCVSCEDLQGTDDILGVANTTISTEKDLNDFLEKHFRKYAQLEGFHIIEHILLRPRAIGDTMLPIELHTEEEDCECVEVRDPYSFRASVILPSWPEQFRSIRFRQHIEKVLRAEAPTHVYLRICWINHCEMQAFERCYNAWSDAHAVLDCEFRGIQPLPDLIDISNAKERQRLEEHQVSLNEFIEKLYSLTNIFSVARIHGCDDIDSDEPQISLNNTNLGSL